MHDNQDTCANPRCQCCWNAVGFMAAFASFLDTHEPAPTMKPGEVRRMIREQIEKLGHAQYGEKWAKFRSNTFGRFPPDDEKRAQLPEHQPTTGGEHG